MKLNKIIREIHSNYKYTYNKYKHILRYTLQQRDVIYILTNTSDRVKIHLKSQLSHRCFFFNGCKVARLQMHRSRHARSRRPFLSRWNYLRLTYAAPRLVDSCPMDRWWMQVSISFQRSPGEVNNDRSRARREKWKGAQLIASARINSCPYHAHRMLAEHRKKKKYDDIVSTGPDVSVCMRFRVH